MKQPLTLPIDPSAPLGIGFEDLLCWLRLKLAEAEHSLKCREAMANLKPMTDEDIEQIKALPGTRITKGRKLSKAAFKEIEEEPLRHKRIAVKCRREVEMFKATIAAISQHNVEASHARPVAHDCKPKP